MEIYRDKKEVHQVVGISGPENFILDTNADSPQPLSGKGEYDLNYFFNNPYVSGFEEFLGEELGLQAEESVEEFLRYLRNEFGVGVRDYDRKALVLRILNLLKFFKDKGISQEYIVGYCEGAQLIILSLLYIKFINDNRNFIADDKVWGHISKSVPHNIILAYHSEFGERNIPDIRTLINFYINFFKSCLQNKKQRIIDRVKGITYDVKLFLALFINILLSSNKTSKLLGFKRSNCFNDVGVRGKPDHIFWFKVMQKFMEDKKIWIAVPSEDNQSDLHTFVEQLKAVGFSNKQVVTLEGNGVILNISDLHALFQKVMSGDGDNIN